jgi:hypothetical protein
LIDQQRAEHFAMAGMVNRLHEGLTHHSRGTSDAVEARVSAHFEDGGNAASFLPHRMRPRIEEFDFGRRVRAIAKLVFQTLDIDAVAIPVRQPARHKEAGQAAVRLCEHQVGIALRRGEEPLMAGDAV